MGARGLVLAREGHSLVEAAKAAGGATIPTMLVSSICHHPRQVAAMARAVPSSSLLVTDHPSAVDAWDVPESDVPAIYVHPDGWMSQETWRAFLEAYDTGVQHTSRILLTHGWW